MPGSVWAGVCTESRIRVDDVPESAKLDPSISVRFLEFVQACFRQRKVRDPNLDSGYVGLANNFTRALAVGARRPAAAYAVTFCIAEPDLWGRVGLKVIVLREFVPWCLKQFSETKGPIRCPCCRIP